jgi:hypothetical protein
LRNGVRVAYRLDVLTGNPLGKMYRGILKIRAIRVILLAPRNARKSA